MATVEEAEAAVASAREDLAVACRDLVTAVGSAEGAAELIGMSTKTLAALVRKNTPKPGAEGDSSDPSDSSARAADAD